MNREQKAATIEALVSDIEGADAVFAVDYRGISVPQAAELRTKLREADATFRVVKNSLSERAADQAGVEALKALLQGPTALTFVRGDAALAAKAIADYARTTQLLPFKGGVMNGDTLDADQIRAISRLPSREILYAQLVGVVASPVTGLVRTLSALIGGLAVALGQVREKKESGEVAAGDPPSSPAAEVEQAPAGPAPGGEEAAAEPASAAEASSASTEQTPVAERAPGADGEAAQADAPAEAAPAATPAAEGSETPITDGSPAGAAGSAPEASAAATAQDAPQEKTESENAPTPDDNQADASA